MYIYIYTAIQYTHIHIIGGTIDIDKLVCET